MKKLIFTITFLFLLNILNADIILDVTNTNNITVVGTWPSSTYVPGFFGAYYLHDENSGKGTKSVLYTTPIPRSGKYEVALWYPANENRSTNTPVDIIHADATNRVIVNQRLNGQQWYVIGTYPFKTNQPASVRINNEGTTSGHVLADGLRFRFVPSVEVKMVWNPNTEPDLAGYKMYQSTNFFNTPSTNFITILTPSTNASSIVDFDNVYAYHLTAYNTAGLESEPSNEIRFQLLTAYPNLTNSFTLTGFTNWQSAILIKPPTNGVISGTPPNIFYRSTNVTAYKDHFSYSIERRPLVSAGTNKVYTLLQTPKVITIDGNLSEWPFAYELVHPTFSIPKGSNVVNLVTYEKYGAGTYTGTNDHSIVFKALHDLSNIYLGISVRDDYHISTNNSAWNGDSIQLMIANSNRTQVVRTFNASLNGVDGALSNSITATYSSTNYSLPQIAIARNNTTKITTYEIRIPSDFAGVDFSKTNATFGLGFAINDGDPSAPGQGGWSGFGPHSMVFGQSPSETALFRVSRDFPVTNILSFSPTDDAYLQGTTLYNDNYLKVQPDVRVSYLKFNVDGITSNVLKNATLRLQENGDVGSGTIRVHRGSHNNWTETSLSSTNAPVISEQVGMFTGVISSNQVVNINVTPLITGDGTYSMIMTMDVGDNDVWFGSKESSVLNPLLTIETVGGIEHPVVNYYSIDYITPERLPAPQDLEIINF